MSVEERIVPDTKSHNDIQVTLLSFGYLPVTGHAKIFIAKEEGYFKSEGLDVTLVEFTNSADGLSALRAGKLDVGAFGTTAPLVHISKGAELSIIGGIMGEDAAIVTTAENAAKIKSVGDLKGKKIATVRLATGDAVLRGALDANGIDWKKDITLFELKNPPAVIEAIKSNHDSEWKPGVQGCISIPRNLSVLLILRVCQSMFYRQNLLCR